MQTALKSVAHILFFCVLSMQFLPTHAQKNCCFHDRESACYRRQKQIRPTQAQTQSKKTKKASSKNIDARSVLHNLYDNINGHHIPDEDTAFIQKKGGAPTYGEIKPDALSALLQDLAVTKKDVLYDLGSGTGKVVTQAYLEFPFKKVVGIELSEYRYKQAMHVLDSLKKRGLIKKKRVMRFIHGDIVEASIADATIIYMCSTCFSDELMTKLAEKFARLKKGLHIITLKQIPHPKKYNLKLKREYRLAMSWSFPEGSPVYVYRKIR